MDAVTGLRDIIKNIGVISKNVLIKVVGSETGVSASAMDGKLDAGMVYAAGVNGCNSEELPSVVCNGELHQPIPELINCIIGLTNLDNFNGFCQIPDQFSATVVTNGSIKNAKPIELRFDYESGGSAWYRFKSDSFTSALVKVPPTRCLEFEVVSTPTAKSIALFKHFAKEAAKASKHHFWAGMNARGKLYFSFDERCPTYDTQRFEFDGGLMFAKMAPYAYSATAVLDVLKLTSSSKSVSGTCQ
jgi:hypothetical protein